MTDLWHLWTMLLSAWTLFFTMLQGNKSLCLVFFFFVYFLFWTMLLCIWIQLYFKCFMKTLYKTYNTKNKWNSIWCLNSFFACFLIVQASYLALETGIQFLSFQRVGTSPHILKDLHLVAWEMFSKLNMMLFQPLK